MKDVKPIILVDDDDLEATILRRMFKDLKMTRPLVHVIDGEEAIRYIDDDTNERPFLILLDLNMPRMGGLECLCRIKSDNRFKAIPVVVVTTSSSENDRRCSFEYGASGYFVKRGDYKSALAVFETIMCYWTMTKVCNARKTNPQAQPILAGSLLGDGRNCGKV